MSTRNGARPRVVYIDHVARLSGGEIALLRVLPALQEHVDAHVILGEDGVLVERLRESGIPVEVIPIEPRLRDVRKATVRLTSIDPRTLSHLVPYVARLRRRLSQLRPDLIHTNSLKSALYGGAAGRLAGVPVVWHIRDRIEVDYLPKAAVRIVRLASYCLPAAVVAYSDTTLASLPSVRRGRVFGSVVPDGLPPTASHRKRSVMELRVGILGRIAPWKGQHVFLAAFAEAFAGSDVLGRVIGSPMFGETEYGKRLVKQAEDLGIARQIEFRGFREDVAAELDQLDVLVHCSTVPEPFGQVVLEGMAAGLVVVASAEGGPAEIIEDGKNGLLTPPGDVRALAATLQRLRDDPDARDRLGRAALLRSADFTPERTAAGLLDVYRGILEER